MTQPRNYLTQMLDNLSDCTRRMTTSDAGHAKRFIAGAKSAVCFDLPRGGQLITGDPGLARLPLDAEGFTRPPFDVIAVEFDITCSDGSVEQVVIVAMHDEKHGGVLCIPSYKTFAPDDSWRVAAFGFLLPYKGLGVRKADGGWQHKVQFMAVLPDAIRGFAHEAGYADADEYVEALYSESMSYYMLGYLHLCAAIWTHEVSFEDMPPHKGQNRMRRARGKAPLFTYKVLTIGKRKRRSQYKGGTHASPRSHLRRGYYRMSKNGKRHWVQPCMVKGETPGFVHKDYKMEDDTDGCDAARHARYPWTRARQGVSGYPR